MKDLIRVGHGFDVHQLGDRRGLILGGVEIPYHQGLQGHSDADVLIHAICDALLGASGLGDIGNLFPDTDDRNLNRNSREFLVEVRRLLQSRRNGAQRPDHF